LVHGGGHLTGRPKKNEGTMALIRNRKYQLITCEGYVTFRDRMSLKAMQEFVKGPVELVRNGKSNIWCNENGRLLNLPINKRLPMLVGNIIVERK